MTDWLVPKLLGVTPVNKWLRIQYSLGIISLATVYGLIAMIDKSVRETFTWDVFFVPNFKMHAEIKYICKMFYLM